MFSKLTGSGLQRRPGDVIDVTVESFPLLSKLWRNGELVGLLPGDEACDDDESSADPSLYKLLWLRAPEMCAPEQRLQTINEETKMELEIESKIACFWDLSLTRANTMDLIRNVHVANELFRVVENRAIQCRQLCKMECRTECASHGINRHFRAMAHSVFDEDSVLLALGLLPTLGYRRSIRNSVCRKTKKICSINFYVEMTIDLYVHLILACPMLIFGRQRVQWIWCCAAWTRSCARCVHITKHVSNVRFAWMSWSCSTAYRSIQCFYTLFHCLSVWSR